ncbi:MAG: chlorite dismutase family protein [Metallosphaera prunae]|nr:MULTISPECIES: chlorite dismutase family protein [Metallosphaera]MCY0862381.1 chlorite dismutase family protein [Metallosphaera prunae]
MTNEVFMQVLSIRFLPQWWSLSKGERAKILGLVKEVEEQEGKNFISIRRYASINRSSSLVYWLSSETTTPLVKFRSSLLSALRGYADEDVLLFSVFRPSPYTRGNFNPKDVLNSPPLKYFVAYPMKKDVEWYLIPFQEREEIMREHIKVAREHPGNKGIRSYTTYSFGIADYEFVVIYEIPSLPEWIQVVEALREVRARKWITKEEPLVTGELMGLEFLYS